MIPGALLQFSDYIQARLRVEPHVITGRPETEPIALPGRAPGVLCVHGFTGVPAEVQVGCEAAQSLGLATEAPLLAGHGTSTEELAKTTFDDWYDSVEPAFDRLRQNGPVILLGLSLGSLITTRLALARPSDVAAMVLLANAFWLKEPYPALALDWAERLGLPDFSMPKKGSDLGDLEALKTHVSYQVQPVRAATSVLRAGERMRERVHRIKCPTLIVHGARDRVCPVQNAWRVAEKMTIPDVRVVVLPRSHHILTRDVERERLFQELQAFLGRFSDADTK